MAFGDLYQHNNNYHAAGPSQILSRDNWPANINAHSLVLLLVVATGTGLTASVTSDQTPTTLTKRLQVENPNSGASGRTLFVFEALDHAGGVKPEFTMTVSPAAEVYMDGVEFLASAATNLDQTKSAIGNDTVPSSGTTGTRSDATELQVGAGSVEESHMVTAGSGFNKWLDYGPLIGENILRTAAGTQAADLSVDTTKQWIMATLTYRDTVPVVPGGTYQLNYHR